MNEEDQRKAKRIAQNAEEKRRQIEIVADMAQRDQNDADVQEIARQVGVFCRGLDEAGVKHYLTRSNEDRKDAVMGFILAEISRLRRKQDEEDG